MQTHAAEMTVGSPLSSAYRCAGSANTLHRAFAAPLRRTRASTTASSPAHLHSIRARASEHPTGSSSRNPVDEDFVEDLTRDSRRGSDTDDWERRQTQALRERTSWREGLSFKPESLASSQREESLGDKVQGAFDKVLIADFFLVCLALLLLVMGLGEKVALDSSNILDLWLPAWPLIVQPAIGILMAGALLSGLVGWFKSDIATKR